MRADDRHFPENGVHPAGLPEFSDQASQRVDLHRYLAVARRRWWILIALPAVAVAYVMFHESRLLPRYTAQVMLQRHVRAAPLNADNGRLQSVGLETVPSDLEILRSVAVVGDVVDSLGLRLSISPAPRRRADVLLFARTDPDAPPAHYEIARSAGATGLGLFRDGHEVAPVSGAGSVDYKGLHFQLTPGAHLRVPLGLTVGDRADVIDGLRYSINPGQVRGTSLIRVTYSSGDPEMSAAVLNTLAVSYANHVARQARDEATRRRQFLAASLLQISDSLRDAKAALTNYQRASQTIDPQAEGAAASTAMTAAESNLRAIQFQEGVLQDLLTSVQTSNPDDGSLQRLVAVSQELVPAIDDFYRQLRDLDSQRSRLTSSRYGYTAQSRSVQTIDSLIAATRSDMRGATEEALRLVRTKEQAIQGDVARARGNVEAMPTKATTFSTLRQNVEATQRNYDLLSQRLYEAQLSEAVEAGDVEVVDPARAPEGPDPIDRRRAIVMALLASLAAAIGIITIIERLDRSVRTSADATRATGLPILGVIPDFGKGDHRSTTSGMDAFRKLRTTLRFARADRLQLIAVTSSAPAEGKSVTAANLAYSIAQGGGRVLLIDGDLHRPTVHTLLGKAKSPGLSDVLVGESTLEGALTNHGVLSVLTCGTSAPHPSELLASARFTEFLAELRTKFDTIVLDTPAVHAVADAATEAMHADGVLVIARAESTDRLSLAHAVEQMRRVNAKVIGIVMNCVPVGFNSYASYYGYYEYADYSARKASGKMSEPDADLIVGDGRRKAPSRFRAMLGR